MKTDNHQKSGGKNVHTIRKTCCQVTSDIEENVTDGREKYEKETCLHE